MMERAQAQNPAPETATKDKEHESVPSTEVTMLAEYITNKPENQRYSNLQEYFEISESVSAGNENHVHNTTVHECTDDIHSKSETSVVDSSDQDPTYEVLTAKKKRIAVYPSQSKSSGSSSSSSPSSTSGSSSDSSDTESYNEQNKTQENNVQGTAEKQSEQTDFDEPATTEVSISQELRHTLIE